jgi:aminoglycoside N3'-acetyltransferase
MDMRGREERGDEFESDPILNASIRPGLTIMLHSSGTRLSQLPLSDQAKIKATALVDLVGCNGTVRYPPCDAELEGDKELASDVVD